MSGGPSSDEFTFRHEYVPDKHSPGDVKLIAACVEAMEHGWVVMIDEVNTIRDVHCSPSTARSFTAPSMDVSAQRACWP
jgi:hypothetical protein